MGSAHRLHVSDPRCGFTFVEVLVASVLASLVAGGTLVSFITASRLTGERALPETAEISLLAQETLERLRNRVDTDSNFLPAQATASVDGGGNPVWIDDSSFAPADRGSGSVLLAGGGTKRCYRVIGEDCDGDGIQAGGSEVDCYAVQVKVCWNDLTGCPCP